MGFYYKKIFAIAQEKTPEQVAKSGYIRIKLFFLWAFALAFA